MVVQRFQFKCAGDFSHVRHCSDGSMDAVKEVSPNYSQFRRDGDYALDGASHDDSRQTAEHRYSCHFAGRFSRNAAIPSCASNWPAASVIRQVALA